MRIGLILTCLLVAGPALAQEDSNLRADNPLSILHDELSAELEDAGVPFTEEQERAIALMMDERERASEDLFGDLMDFRDGPTRGQDADRLRSAIAWMQGEFLNSIENYLDDAQLAVWRRIEETGGPSALGTDGDEEPPPAETQLVRINNNPFTAEDDRFRRGGRGTEVIPRGGAGSFHGNAGFLMKDDALNARNAFASNKPPYQERQLQVDFGGPVVPGRLSATGFLSRNEAENVDTINATLPGGDVFALGITRPTVNRNLGGRATYQLADGHSFRGNARYRTQTRRDQGIGGFNLPERAYDRDGSSWNVQVEQFSTFSSRSLYETRFTFNHDRSETIPASDDVRINVLDAFGSGGSQNRNADQGTRYSFGNLYTRFGNGVTLKAGTEGTYRIERSVERGNFGGTFTFSSLADFEAGRPLTYRVNVGDPTLETRQFEVSFFVQSDHQVSPQLTLMFGARYDVQTNLDDHNNFSPRVGFAYSPGRNTVIRGGGGMFYDTLQVWMVDAVRRFDGTRQFELVVEDPSYPDPFDAGEVRQTRPSVRVMDPALEAPKVVVGMVSLERTLFDSLFLTLSYDFQRQFNRFRVRNLNAPFDATAAELRACRPDQTEETCLRPFPAQGDILNLESTGNEVRHNVRLNARQRFSIFNVSASYSYQHAYGDTTSDGFGEAPTDNYDLRGDWARAGFPTHEIDANVNAQLPLGLFLTGRLSASSGRRYTIITGVDDNHDNTVNDRPVGVPRNSEVGPRYLNVDFNVSKAFFLGRSGANVNVFANMTNAFNHVHLNNPSGVMTSPNFGRITSARNPREIEAGLRFQF